MKILKFNIFLIILGLFMVSCSKDDGTIDDKKDNNPMENFHKITEFTEGDYSFSLYTEKEILEVGYNEISILIRDNTTDSYLPNADITWLPMMDMGEMEHSTPHSILTPRDNKTYDGYIIFIMAGDGMMAWDLTISLKINDKTIENTVKIDVFESSSNLVKFQSFKGTDNIQYYLAYVDPKVPEQGINNLTAVLYQMDEMMSFNLVKDYTIPVDPRMPDMGNHDSINNEDMAYSELTEMYEGKLSLTMTGYWRINLKLLNRENELIKGQDVTEENKESDLYFEIEL